MDILLNINVLGLTLYNNSFISKDIFGIIKIILYLYIIILCFEKNFSKKEIVLFIFSIVIFFMTKRLYLSTFLLIIIFFNYKYYKRYYLLNFILLSFLLLSIILFSKLDIIENNILKYNIYGYQGIQIRQSLGFSNPNMVGIIFTTIRYSFYYLNYYKLKLYHFFILGFLTYYFYFQTYSRTLLLVFYFEIILFYIIKYRYVLLKKIIIAIPILHMFSFFLGSIFFYNTKLNNLLSNRLSYSYIFFKNLNLKSFLFGNKKDFYLPLDNAWTALLQNYGIIVTIIMLILITNGIKKLLLFEREFKIKKIIFLFLICLFNSTSEAILFSPYYSFITIILIKYNFYSRKKNDRSKNIKKNSICKKIKLIIGLKEKNF